MSKKDYTYGRFEAKSMILLVFGLKVFLFIFKGKAPLFNRIVFPSVDAGTWPY